MTRHVARIASLVCYTNHPGGSLTTSDIFSTYNKGYRSHVSITHSGGFLIVLHQFQNHIFLIDDKISAAFNRTVLYRKGPIAVGSVSSPLPSNKCVAN